MEEPTVLTENPVVESEPQINPAEAISPEIPAESSDEVKPVEEHQSRARERIQDTIAQKKEAERIAAEKSQEAQYWKAQALANQPVESDELDGVTDEGIDPVKYAKSLKEQILKEVKEAQGISQSQNQFNKELAEVATDPIMKSKTAQMAVSRIINADKVSPTIALDMYKEELEEIRQEVILNNKVRNEAGQFVRQETASPSIGRGTSGSSTYFTKEQIQNMSMDEYKKNIDEINSQMNRGLIK